MSLCLTEDNKRWDFVNFGVRSRYSVQSRERVERESRKYGEFIWPEWQSCFPSSKLFKRRKKTHEYDSSTLWRRFLLQKTSLNVSLPIVPMMGKDKETV